MNYMNTQKDRYLNKKLGEHKDKIRLIKTKEKAVSHAYIANQNFNEFMFALNGDFNSDTVKILVPNTIHKSQTVFYLLWSIKHYKKLTPSYKSQLKEIIIPTFRSDDTPAYFVLSEPNTVYIFDDFISNYSSQPTYAFFHETTHVVDYAKGTYKFSNVEFKNLFYTHAQEQLSPKLYNKFKRITENRKGINLLNDSEKGMIRTVFSSNYGHNSWERYVKKDSRYTGKAFSEEFADCVACIASDMANDRPVSNNIKKYILKKVLI